MKKVFLTVFAALMLFVGACSNSGDEDVSADEEEVEEESSSRADDKAKEKEKRQAEKSDEEVDQTTITTELDAPTTTEKEWGNGDDDEEVSVSGDRFENSLYSLPIPDGWTRSDVDSVPGMGSNQGASVLIDPSNNSSVNIIEMTDPSFRHITVNDLAEPSKAELEGQGAANIETSIGTIAGYDAFIITSESFQDNDGFYLYQVGAIHDDTFVIMTIGAMNQADGRDLLDMFMSQAERV